MRSKKTIEEIREIYDLELDKAIKEIKSSKAKLVLLQFPDGLKLYATTIVDYLKENTKAEFLIWMDSCFGACDTPTGIDKLNPKIDLIIQFGHNELMPSYC
jgi:2-(3-amino-3-carboxypropyl)histidine synthase